MQEAVLATMVSLAVGCIPEHHFATQTRLLACLAHPCQTLLEIVAPCPCPLINGERALLLGYRLEPRVAGEVPSSPKMRWRCGTTQ